MALADFTEDRPRREWQRPSRGFPGPDMASGIKVLGAAGQARPQRETTLSSDLPERTAIAEARQAELTNELELALTRLSGTERRGADEKAACADVTEQPEALKEENAEAAGRVAGFEAELAAERNGAGLQQNEIESLRNSLDLAISENSRMAARVDLAESLLAESRVQSECLRAEAVTADVQRIKTVDIAHRSEEMHQAETRKLQDDLAAMTARARTAETLLADARECLVIRIAESEKLAYSLAQATEANRDADIRLAELQDLLRTKELQIAQIERSRQALMTKAQKLLENHQSRDQALARAEEKIKLLDQWIVRLEAEARRSRDAAAKAVAQVAVAPVAVAPVAVALVPTPPGSEICAPAEDPREAKRKKWMELARELAKLELKLQLPSPSKTISTQPLLAGTITY